MDGVKNRFYKSVDKCLHTAFTAPVVLQVNRKLATRQLECCYRSFGTQFQFSWNSPKRNQ